MLFLPTKRQANRGVLGKHTSLFLFAFEKRVVRIKKALHIYCIERERERERERSDWNDLGERKREGENWKDARGIIFCCCEKEHCIRTSEKSIRDSKEIYKREE